MEWMRIMLILYTMNDFFFSSSCGKDVNKTTLIREDTYMKTYNSFRWEENEDKTTLINDKCQLVFLRNRRE